MANPQPGTHQRSVKSTRTMFNIVHRLKELDGAHVTELADDLGLAKSSIHQHLATLDDLGYVVKEDGKYYVGLGFLTLAEYAKQRKEVYRLSKPMVAELAEETGERAQFFVEEHGRAIYLHTEQGRHAVRADRWVGTRRYMHSCAGGKAMLANYPPTAVEDIIDRWGLPAETEHTITDRQELSEELEKIRSVGYSLNREESIDGLRAIGVPVKDADGDVLGAFSISGPSHRFQGEWFERTVPNLLLGKANELELKIAYSD